VEESLRLMAVERDVGCVQVEHDLGRRAAVRLQKQVAQQPVQTLGRVTDLVIATGAANQLQTVQRALAGQRFIQIALATEHRQQRIRAQLLMIVEVLVTQRQPVDALRQHLGQMVLDQQRRPAVAEAARQSPQQVDLAVHLAQKQSPAVGRHLEGGKPRFHAARKMGCKCERFLVTLCHKKGRLRTATTTSRQRCYAIKRRPFQVLF
jgi:hypothetical protein